MKLTKKEKERLIGKKIVVGEVIKKENDWPIDVTSCFKKSLRTIKIKVLKKTVKAAIVGFTHVCEGKFDCDDDGIFFVCTKRIPCIKIASGVTGKMQFAPMSIIEKKGVKVCFG